MENNDTLIAKTPALEIVVLALLRDASPRSAAQADEMQDFLDSWRHATGPNPARPE